MTLPPDFFDNPENEWPQDEAHFAVKHCKELMNEWGESEEYAMAELEEIKARFKKIFDERGYDVFVKMIDYLSEND